MVNIVIERYIYNVGSNGRKKNIWVLKECEIINFKILFRCFDYYKVYFIRDVY